VRIVLVVVGEQVFLAGKEVGLKNRSRTRLISELVPSREGLR